MSFKRCSDCGEVKPFDEFPNNKGKKDGKRTHCKSCHNARNAAWRDANPEKEAASQRRRNLRNKYGLTVEQWDEMYERQGGKCFICENEEATHVDHDHSTGDVRALLCHGCNAAIGLFKEDPDAMIAGAMYILMHQGAYDVHS